MKSERYAVEHIELSYVEPQGDIALLEIHDVELRNFNLHAELLKFDERVQHIFQVWNNSDKLPPEVTDLLQRHQNIVTDGSPIPPAAETLVAQLQDALTDLGPDLGIYRQGGEDLLPDLLHALKLAEALPAPDLAVDEIDPGEIELKRRVVREWRRWAASRGAASARFRQGVREAYRWTCVVCGVTYPRTTVNRVAGVDAAHILPWAEYDLDHEVNGLCLCKQHHWAFDEGILAIARDAGAYIVQLLPETEERLTKEAPGFSVEELKRHQGPIPQGRLPADPRQWPDPELLRLCYESYHAT